MSAHPSPPMSDGLPTIKIIRTIVLAAWCGLFWFLLVADRTSLYLSSRTDWVVPVGAVILTGATLGSLFTIAGRREAPPTTAEVSRLALMILPVIVILAVPPATLGSYAAERRSSVIGGSYVSSASDITDGDLTLIDVGGALRSKDAMKALSERAGSAVSFIGFVARDRDDPADEFTLTRFMVSCCVADALSVEVRVVGAPPGRFAKDDWVKVEGQIYPLGTEVVIDASSVTSVPRPKRPYLEP